MRAATAMDRRVGENDEFPSDADADFSAPSRSRSTSSSGPPLQTDPFMFHWGYSTTGNADLDPHGSALFLA
jgi:hypothetical protein